MLNKYIQKKVNEEIEKRGYTDAALLAILRSVEGGQADAQVTATGAVQASASLLARCFAMAEISPMPAATILSPQILYDVGHALMTDGEACYLIEVDEAEVTLTRAASWDIRDGRKGWRYKMTLAGPTATRTQDVSGEAVFHPRINVDSSQPHKGRSPAEIAGYSATLAANLERSLADETGGSTGNVLPHPDGVGGEALSAIKNDLAKLKGKTALVPSMSKGFGETRTGAPDDWKPRRLGANPPESVIKLRDDAHHVMLAACGIPPSIFGEASNANAAREGLRQFLFTTINPIAELVATEARLKIHPQTTFNFEKLQAADVQGRARGAKALVDAGFSKEEAAAMTGFKEAD